MSPPSRRKSPEPAGSGFRLPPDVQVSRHPLDGGIADTFRHAQLGELGRMVVKVTPSGETSVAAEVAGDVDDPMTQRCHHVNVDVTHYEAGSLRPPRPDTAQKNRAANAALEHDKWFRAHVREVRDGLKDGTVDLVDSETMWGRLRARARELDAGQAKPTSKQCRKA